MLPPPLSRLVRKLRKLPETLQARAIRREFIEALLDGPGEFERYRQELDEAGLVRRARRQRDQILYELEGTTDRGNPYGIGTLNPETAVTLYALLRHYQPETLVETGVCSGMSTSVLLQALHENGKGHLYSIDLPEYADKEDNPEFWEGKGGAVIPPGKEPGWLVPEGLRDRWTLTLGPSQEELEPLLEELGSIDLFMHDSEHSYECMTFEFETSLPYLTEGGFMLADDVSWNDSFTDFAETRGYERIAVGPDTELIRV